MSILFPTIVTNEYRGSRVALGVFAVITGISIIRSLIHILAPDGGAGSIATMPLGQYGAEAAAAVIHTFALWGLSQLLLAAVSLVVLLRYRSLIPFMYLLTVCEYSVRLLLGFVIAIVMNASPDSQRASPHRTVPAGAAPLQNS